MSHPAPADTPAFAEDAEDLRSDSPPHLQPVRRTSAAPAKLPRLMLGYFALAAIFFVTLAASLYVHGSLASIQRELMQTNEAWARRQADYAELSRLAAAVDAPANDVFVSHDEVGERLRMETALRPFGDAVAASRTELEIVRVIDTPEATHIRYRVRR